MFDEVVERAPGGLADGEGFVVFDASGGIVNRSWTSVIPTRHLLDGCITKSLLFLKDPVKEY